MTLYRVIFLLAAIVLVFALDLVLPLEQFGLRPRHLDGLVGIVAMPFLHANLSHLCANLAPLAVLLGMLAVSDARPLATAAAIAVLGGVLTWLFARSGNHVGASGLVFGLAAYLIARGLSARSLPALLVAGVTASLYGATLLGGVVPTAGPVSWDGHLAGAVAGVLIARGAGRAATGGQRS